MVSTKSNIDFYSVVLQAYNSLDYCAKLAYDNEIDVNEDLSVGQSISYEGSLYVKQQVDVKVSPSIQSQTFNIESTEGQSWVDLALMGYMGLDNAMSFAYSNNLPNVNRGLVDRQSFIYSLNQVRDIQSLSDRSGRGIVYATGYDETFEDVRDGCFILREDGGYMLREDGSRIRRERCDDYILREDGFYLLREDGFKFIRE